MASFLGSASKRVTDIRSFLRDAAGGSSIKYVAEKGTRHQIYFPYIQTEDDEGNKTKIPVAISGNVHECQSNDGKFRSIVCMADTIRKDESGQTLNDGSCPFCDRVSDAWDIYNYRKEKEENECKLVGDDRKKHLDKAFSSFADERKAKAPRSYMYILVVKFNTDAQGTPVKGKNGLPDYELKVMKLSASRMERIQQQLQNSGSDIVDSEVIFEYPSVDDKRIQVSQSTTAPVFPNNKLTAKYPELLENINKDVEKFDWDGISKAFPEWNGMTVDVARTTVNNLFEKWDEYREALKSNPDAKYLEYTSNTVVTKPEIGGGNAVPGIGQGPVIPGMSQAPVIPGMNGVDQNQVQSQQAPQMPQMQGMNDVNAVFGNMGNIKI